MNGIDLLNNLIDELNRARDYISEMSDHSSNSVLEDELVDDIKDDTEENRQKIIDVAPGRLYNFIPGLIIIKTILEYYNVKYLHFCSGQLDDGVLYELLENESSKDKPVDPSSQNEFSNSSYEKALASSKLISNPTGNPIVVLILVFFSIFVSCYKRKS